MKFLKRLLKIRYFFLLAFFACLVVFVYFYIFYNLPSPNNLKDYKVVPISTHILDRNGKLLYEIYREQNRTPIKLDKLPKYVWQATVSIEDKDYFHHGGVSLFGGIFRAAKDTLIKKNLQGGSTITQQLVKSALLTPERTIRRKVKEIILAIWTERLFSKQEILELYLNQVPYGGSAYGIEEAAKTYFNKHAKDLKLEEAAYLAGLPQAPSLYSPFVNPDLAIRRRNEVLRAMTEQKYITEKQREQAQTAKLNIQTPQTTIKAPHFVFYVKSYLEKLYGIQQVEEGGLTVTTSLDLDIQQKSEQILKDELEKVKNLNVSNGAILVTRPPTGEVLAMVGSVNYFASPSGAFNVTTQALRQPGSSIKPINYAIGLERHLVTPATIFLDVPTCFFDPGQPKRYCPVNYDGRFHGAVTLRQSLGSSFNIPAVKMLKMNGVQNFIASASAYTINTFNNPRGYGLSLTLGGGEVTMIEMSQAFSAFANRGKAKEVVSILKVEDKNKKVLYEFKDGNYASNVKKALRPPNYFAITGKQATSPETAFLISHILLDNSARTAAFGTSSFLVVPKRTVSVKTGTTDDKKDNWTIGYTPNFLTTVWVGNNDGKPMNPILTSGVTGAAPIWNKVMTYLLKDQPDLKPVRPDTVVSKNQCAFKAPDGGCVNKFEFFIKGTERIASLSGALSTKRQTVWVTKDSDKLSKEGDPNAEPKEKTITTDGISMFCLDCAGDQPQQPTPHP